MQFVRKILNISEHEIPRTMYAWTILFLYRLGFIVGTTTLIAMAVSQFGINNLPFIVLIQAVLTILGMFLTSFLYEHFTSKTLIPFAVLITSILIFSSTFFLGHKYIFFGLLLVVTGVLLPQITIFLANYIEDFFTPLESGRTVPLIESAQTIGGIIAGILIAALSQHISSYKFFYLWILFLSLTVVVILFLEPFSPEHHHIFQKQEKSKKGLRTGVKKIRENFNEIRLVPFLRGLLFIFLLHWVVGYIFDYQYTKLIDDHVVSTESASHEEGLTNGLASFHILFNATALVVQLLVASRVFKKIGTVGSFLLHSIVTFLSSVSLLFGFGYFTVILSKNNFELSGIIHKSAYESSYYALKHGSQRKVREFFEAFITPVGTILGTLFVLSVEFFFASSQSFFIFQLLLVVLTVAMIVFSLRLQHSYTKLSKDNLVTSSPQVAKLRAIEILSQKGHDNHLPVLFQTLRNPKELPAIKSKILSVFYTLADTRTIPSIIEFLHSDNEELIYSSVHALSGFKNLGQKVFEESFSRYRVIDELKLLFERTSSEKIRIAVIQTLACLHYHDIVPFLLHAMKKSSITFLAACIKVFSLFHDPSVVEYLKPYLKSPSASIRAQTVAVLWQFSMFHRQLRQVLSSLFHSGRREDFLAYCSVIGDIGSIQDQKSLLTRFECVDPVLKFTIDCALFKLGNHDVIDSLVHLLFSKNSLVLAKAAELLVTLKTDQKRILQNAIRRATSHHLEPVYSSHSHSLSADISFLLQRCYEVYHLIDLKAEALHIGELITPEYQQLQPSLITT